MMRRLKNFKQKEFYLVLLLGFVSVFTLITIIYSDKVGDKGKKTVIDLNEPDDTIKEDVSIVDHSNKEVDDVQELPKPIIEFPTSDFTVVNGELIGSDGKVFLQVPAKDVVKEDEEDVADSEDTQSVINVIAGGKKDKTEELSFKEEDGMKWPLIGEILLPYSMDKGIYFATLDQYKCNPAICIKAEVGTAVNAAAEGKVEKIETDNEETGITVTLDHGSGYKTIYGQLKEVVLKEGDMVAQGASLGVIENPTKYYVKNGPNLYFKILKDGKPIDPSKLVK